MMNGQGRNPRIQSMLAFSRAAKVSSTFADIRQLASPSTVSPALDLLVACGDVLELGQELNVTPFLRPLAKPYVARLLADEWQRLQRQQGENDDIVVAKRLGELSAAHAAADRTTVAHVNISREKILDVIKRKPPQAGDFVNALNHIWRELKTVPYMDSVTSNQMREVAPIRDDDTRIYARNQYMFFSYGLHAIDPRFIAPNEIRAAFDELVKLPREGETVRLEISGLAEIVSIDNLPDVWINTTHDSRLAYIESTIFYRQMDYSNEILSSVFVQLLVLTKGANVTSTWIDRRINLIRDQFTGYDTKGSTSKEVVSHYNKLFPVDKINPRDLYKALITIYTTADIEDIPSFKWIIEQAACHNLAALASIAEFFAQSILVTPGFLIEIGIPESEFVATMKMAGIAVRERYRSLVDIPITSGDYPDLAYLCKEVKNQSEGRPAGQPYRYAGEIRSGWAAYQGALDSRARVHISVLNSIVKSIVSTFTDVTSL